MFCAHVECVTEGLKVPEKTDEQKEKGDLMEREAGQCPLVHVGILTFIFKKF